MDNEKKIDGDFNITKILDTIPFVFCKDIHGRYQGGNLNQATSFGFYHPSEFIGKTIFEILNDQEAAHQIDKTDQEVMQKNVQIITEETLETTKGKKIYLSQKQPVHDRHGQVVGMMGFAMDITEIKNRQVHAESENEKLLKEKHLLEFEHFKKLAEQQSQFHNIAKQIAHDIVSPLSAFGTIISLLNDIPENHRRTLKLAAIRIGDITNNLVKQFRADVEENAGSGNEQEIIFTSLVVQNILSEKRIECHSLPVSFTQDIEPEAYFAFIRTNKRAFERMLSCLIDNAIHSLPNKTGTVQATMRITNDHVFIEIADDGKVMTPDARDKTMRGIAVTGDNQTGDESDMEQLRETLMQSEATLNIKAREPAGNRVIVTFPRMPPPDWTTNDIPIGTDQIIMILDDDPFIHGAWDASLASVLESYPQLKVIHFTAAAKVLAYFNACSEQDRQKLMLFSDYELIGQHTNGLEIIKQLNIKNSILVTSHYEEVEIQNEAIALNIPIIPKLLATKMTLQIVQPDSSGENAEPSHAIDIVMLDDDPVFASAFQFRFSNKKIRYYPDPRDFLTECHEYPKDAVISIDNNFGPAIPINGIEVAKQLHKLGFTRLYLVSGSFFTQSQLPPYLTYIEKLNLDFFDTL